MVVCKMKILYNAYVYYKIILEKLLAAYFIFECVTSPESPCPAVGWLLGL